MAILGEDIGNFLVIARARQIQNGFVAQLPLYDDVMTIVGTCLENKNTSPVGEVFRNSIRFAALA